MPHSFEPMGDDPLLVNITTEFNIVLGIMIVPSDPHFPFGEGVRFSIETTDGATGHLLFPPDMARKIGQGMIDTANHAHELIVPDGWNQDIPG